MLTGHDIICVASIDWDFVWQIHQELMSTLARHGNRVLFIENTGVRSPSARDLPRLVRRVTNWCRSLKGFRKVQDQLWVYSPVILPFPYARLTRWINRALLLPGLRRWMEATGFRDPILWTFLPTGTVSDLVDHLRPKLTVYHCIADFTCLVSRPEKIRRAERELAKRCDLIFAQGHVLKERLAQWNPRVSIVPTGVTEQAFGEDGTGGRDVPADLASLPRPIIGYVGGLHRHVDLELIRAIAAERSDWSIVLIGPAQTDLSALDGAANIVRLGKKPSLQIPRYLGAFDVCLIPYVQSGYTQTVSPSKLHEYHAMGKLVVSTPLPEIAAFNTRYGPIVRLAARPPEFVEQIQQALDERDPARAERRIAIARENTWRERLEDMSQLIEGRLRELTDAAPASWQERFAAMYRRVRRRTLAVTATVVVGYAAIFHSPILWWAAAPLKMVEPVGRAEAIVVFAGGVGESGQAGQGFEERVQYAVELFKQRLAPTLIFSSGAIYAIQEAQVMKALAVSLGVPAEAILLEEEASSTYENVQFSTQIMRSRGFHSALVVSSPYHMRRVQLVWRRQAPDLAFACAPILRSGFFGTQSEVRLRHLRAIAHEYLAIVYYWWKGYL